MHWLTEDQLTYLIQRIDYWSQHYAIRTGREQSDYVSFAYIWIAERIDPKKMSAYRDPETYLLWVARNACQEYNRRENRRRDVLEKHAYKLDRHGHYYHQHHDIFLLRQLTDIIYNLKFKPTNWDIFHKKTLIGYTSSELALIHGINSSDVRHKYKNTRRKIYKAYQDAKKYESTRAKALQRSHKNRQSS